MGSFVFSFALALLHPFYATADEVLPQVQTEGDVFPFLVRAEVSGGHSHSCLNGTEFIVTFTDNIPDEGILQSMNDRLGDDLQTQYRTLRHPEAVTDQVNAMAVCIPIDQDVEAHLQVLLAMEGVEAVEENLPVSEFANVPWHLDRIDQAALPLNNAYRPQGTGKGVRVYVTDTGTDARHPEFEGRVTSGYSAVNGQRATTDMGSHGTHTAGIVGSKNYGVAKDVTIVPVKVFSDRGGGATNVDLIEAINWVISQESRRSDSAVLSMSLGSASNGFYAGEQALLRAAQAGVITIVAAGNDAKDACGYWPAHSRSVITVGSTDRWDRRSSFSNFGACVDIYAPGSAVTSTLPNNRIGQMSGTSMACPVVSGTVALYLQKHPTARMPEMRQALLRNAIGRKNVIASKRMLLVQAVERTSWGLMENTQVQAHVLPSKHTKAHVAGFVTLLLGAGCAVTLIVFMVSSKVAEAFEPKSVQLENSAFPTSLS